MRRGVLQIAKATVAALLVAFLLFSIIESLTRGPGDPPGLFHWGGAYWVAGKSAWAPNYSRCRTCGGALVPMVDELSACRRCERCQVSFRHQSLPKTIEEMDQVWK